MYCEEGECSGVRSMKWRIFYINMNAIMTVALDAINGYERN